LFQPHLNGPEVFPLLSRIGPQVVADHGFITYSEIFPFTPKQPVKDSVLDFAGNAPTLPQESLALKSKALNRSNRIGVSGINVGFESTEIQELESIPKQRVKSLVHVAVAPMSPSQSVSYLGPSAIKVQIE
jgi:hypothetical protein